MKTVDIQITVPEEMRSYLDLDEEELMQDIATLNRIMEVVK